jgi:uncharacterized membrane protein
MNQTTIQFGGAEWWGPVVLVLLAFVGLIIWSYRRAPLRTPLRWLAAMLKIMAIILLSLCLLEPLVSGVRPRPGANIVAVVVDNSRSMTIDGRGLPAGEQMREWLGDDKQGWRARLAQDFDLRLYTFDRDLRRIDSPADLTWDSSHSNLHTSLSTLEERFRDRPLAGVVLLTDGNATDQDDRQAATVRLPFPLHVVVPDKTQIPADTLLDQVQVSQSYFETSPTTIVADVVNHQFEQQPMVVQLRNANGATVQEQTMMTGQDAAATPVRFRFRPEQPGIGFYRVVAFPESQREAYEAGSGGTEATWENNQRTLMVDRGGGPFRILYLAGRPNWEFKFLRRALEKDEELQLVGLLRIANKEPKFQFLRKGDAVDTNRLFQGFDESTEDATEEYDEPVMVRIGVEDAKELAEGFPADARTLFPYDAVILDDVEASYFSPDQMLLLRRYVSQRGGALLMLGGLGTFGQGGYDRTPIGEMLPVYLDRPDPLSDATRISLRLTREGLLETWTRLRDTVTAEETRQQQMTTFMTGNRAGMAKPGAVTVAEMDTGTEQHPAIVTQRFGKGRTGAILIGDLWRWSLRRENVDQDDLAMFWRQATRWLVAEVPRRAEIQVTESSEGADAVRLRVVVRTDEFAPDDEASVEIRVTRPNGETVVLNPLPSDEEAGAYDADFWPQESGGYRVSAKIVTHEAKPLIVRDSGWVTAPEESEFQRLTVDDTRLSQLASSSGGGTLTPDEVDELPQRLQREPVPVTEHWVSPLWHQGWVLGLALACLCGEWGLRRWKGLT